MRDLACALARSEMLVIFAVGGNQDSARAIGVPVTRVKIGLFMFVGFCAWFVGMHLLFAFNTVQSGQGVGNEPGRLLGLRTLG